MKTINIIGDSHTGALGPRLKVALNSHDVMWESFPGFGTGRVLGELTAHPPRPADLTVVALGGNDFGDQTSARIALIRFLRANHAGKILWVGPAYADDASVDARHLAQAQAQQIQFSKMDRAVTWADARPVTREGHGRDGVHFTPSGYDVWAAAIAKRVESTLRGGFVVFALWAGVVGVVGTILAKTLRLGRKV